MGQVMQDVAPSVPLKLPGEHSKHTVLLAGAKYPGLQTVCEDASHSCPVAHTVHELELGLENVPTSHW